MFIFHVEAETPQALLDKIAAKLLAIGFVEQKQGAVAPFPPVDHVPPSVTLPPIETPKEVAAEPAPPPPAATATVAAGSTPSQTSAPASASPAELRAKIRATAAPIMAGPKADDVRKLIARYGGSVSVCKDEELSDLLEDIEELA